MRFRHTVISAITAASLLVLPASSAVAPIASAASGNPPTCRYTDVYTTHAAYADYKITLVDTIYRLKSSYKPKDLVPVSRAGISGSGYLRNVVISDLKAMTKAAAKAGAPIGIHSAYRSYSTQVSTFNHWVAVSGKKAAMLASARPGHSEHQLGTSADFKSKGGGSPFNGDWGKTKAGKWMAANAWKYGWVMSYPKSISPGKTCYKYEPWHFRYVGKTYAKQIHDAGGNSRLFFWKKH